VFFLWHTSRHQPIAVIGGRCRSRADNPQPGTVVAGRVTPCTQELWLYLWDYNIRKKTKTTRYELVSEFSINYCTLLGIFVRIDLWASVRQHSAMASATMVPHFRSCAGAPVCTACRCTRLNVKSIKCFGRRCSVISVSHEISTKSHSSFNCAKCKYRWWVSEKFAIFNKMGCQML